MVFKSLFCKHYSELKFVKLEGTDRIVLVLQVCIKCDKVIKFVTEGD